MAHKCLHNCLRSALLSSTAAERKLHNMHELCITPQAHRHDTAAGPASLCNKSMPSSALRHSNCMSAAAAASSPPSPRLHDASYHDHQLLLGDGYHKLKARTLSCSTKLHCGRLMQHEQAQQTPSSTKSLLHRSLSHGRPGRHVSQTVSCNRLADYQHADEEQLESSSCSRGSTVSSPSCAGEELHTRSNWSSPSLRKLKKAGSGGSGFYGEFDVQEGGGRSRPGRKEKRAPKGHVAVYVEGGKERHVVPIGYLSHPQFQELLQRAESEFGFGQKGGLLLPCSLAELQRALHCIRFHCESS
ncbi:hypothetical protein L7F22_046730 [Adiantum nelumboides]|nr:hypothetical protein [Adiantum nelumboides]